MPEKELKIDHEIKENGHFYIKTPNGLIMITHFMSIGTQVMVYDSPDENPVGYINIKEDKNIDEHTQTTT